MESPTAPLPPSAPPTPQALVARAESLIPWLREEQEATEERGFYSRRLHDKFTEYGFSRILQPRRYGGYEHALTTFVRVMTAIATGCPSTGWCLSLASSHTMIIAGRFSEEAQETIFGPSGDFRSPHSVAPGGSAKRTGDGWSIRGTWRYCSGIPYATHFMGSALVDTGDGPPAMYAAVVPRDQIPVLDDWGAMPSWACAGAGQIACTSRRPRFPMGSSFPLTGTGAAAAQAWRSTGTRCTPAFATPCITPPSSSRP